MKQPSLHLKLGQQLTMTPQLRQAIRLLQLSSIDLQSEIQTHLESNLMLEVHESEDKSDNEGDEEERDITENEEEPQLMWETLGKASRPFQDQLIDSLEPQRTKALTLTDSLVWQLQLANINELDRLIATTLIDAINEDGFLTQSLAEIVKSVNASLTTPVDESQVEMVLHRVQQFDPVGVGARSLEECLALQLQQCDEETPWRDKALLLTQHLGALAKKDYSSLAKTLKVSLANLRPVVHLLQSLDPRPGRQMDKNDPEYIIPDVCVTKKAGVWKVELNPALTPRLQINGYYASLVNGQNTEDVQFLRHQLQEAKWFLKSIENRHHTLLRVARAIVDTQHAFFEHGEEAMKPLVLHDIAKQLDLHDSTISRVTTHKFLTSPRGTYELKYFFSSHIDTQAGGECSATAIRSILKKFISAENPEKPLSDSQLSRLLNDQGIKIARRTVAKYREALAIPPSNERKQLL